MMRTGVCVYVQTVRKTPGGRLSPFPRLPRQRGRAQRLAVELGCPVEKRPVLRPYFDKPMHPGLMLVSVMQPEGYRSVRLRCDLPLHRLHVFLEVMIELLPQTYKEKEERSCAVDNEQGGEHAHIPERQTGAHVPRPESHSSSRRTNPTPRTV